MTPFCWLTRPKWLATVTGMRRQQHVHKEPIFVPKTAAQFLSSRGGLTVKLHEVWCRGRVIFRNPSRALCVDFAQRWKRSFQRIEDKDPSAVAQ